ncbi:MAG: DUF4113 domain-containing protein [Nodosilinea sp.]
MGSAPQTWNCSGWNASTPSGTMMATLDQLNRHLRPDQVKFAALGLNPSWPPPVGLLIPALHHPLAGVSNG